MNFLMNVKLPERNKCFKIRIIEVKGFQDLKCVVEVLNGFQNGAFHIPTPW